MTDNGHIEKETERYMRAAHRVQSAIAATGRSQEAKDLRVGIDLSKADLGGLATLLIAKGLFTKEEYITAIADSAEQEANRYETELSVLYGVNVRTF